MTGETDLSSLLRGMEPKLDARTFNFSSHPDMSLEAAAGFSPIAVFKEPEGLTLICEGDQQPRYSMITLMVHSSLEAVGLTAAVAETLTKEQISANVVAAYYHDHIFVNQNDAKRAMAALQKLSDDAHDRA